VWRARPPRHPRLLARARQGHLQPELRIVTSYDHRWLLDLAREWQALVFFHRYPDGSWKAFLMPFRFKAAN